MNKGLYIHFPFCDAKCLYCDFFSVPDTRKKEAYEKALAKALLSFKDKGICVDTVFFGGGTPSLMSKDGAERIFDALHTAFTVLPDAEITLEANPSGGKEFSEKLKLFRSLGVNRLSLGAQSMSDEELSALGRRHTSFDVELCVENARKAGFDNISLDFMVRIPHQTLATLEKTLSRALSLSPDHLSFYTLTLEDKTVFGARHKKGDSLSLASEEDEETMWERVCHVLSQSGFEHYEISSFAKNKKLSRHNLKYWRGEEYLGLGAGAHSYFEKKRFSFPRSIDAFLSNPLYRENEEFITEKARALEYVMLSLRLSEGISLERLEKEFNTPITPSFIELCKRLENASLAKKCDTLTLTERGRRVSNSIIEKILETLNLI